MQKSDEISWQKNVSLIPEPFELPNESERLTDLAKTYLPPSQNLIQDVLNNEYLPPNTPSTSYLPPNGK